MRIGMYQPNDCLMSLILLFSSLTFFADIFYRHFVVSTDIFYRHFLISTDISVLSIRIGDSKYELLAIADANSVIGVVQWSIFEYIARAAAKILYPIQLMEYFYKQGVLVNRNAKMLNPTLFVRSHNFFTVNCICVYINVL